MRRELSGLQTPLIESSANAARAALEEAQNILRIINVYRSGLTRFDRWSISAMAMLRQLTRALPSCRGLRAQPHCNPLLYRFSWMKGGLR